MTLNLLNKISNLFGQKSTNKKGQTSGEYIALVAGGALFVLIVIVAVNGFFNAPAKQSVIEQGSLVQQQYGTLSGAQNIGDPITLRSPKDYAGLTEFPVSFAFQVNECLTRAELFTDEDGNYHSWEVLPQESLTVGQIAKFEHTIDVEVQFTYDIIVTPCEPHAEEGNGWANGNFNLGLKARQLDPNALRLRAVAAGSQEYVDARNAELDQGSPVGTPTAPTVSLLGETFVSKECNANTCDYTFDFKYNLNKNAQNAQLRFYDSTGQPANIAPGNANSILVNAKSNGDNTFRAVVITRNPEIVGPLPTLEEYKWNLNACTTPLLCATAQDDNNFDFFPSDSAFTINLGRNNDGKLYLNCETEIVDGIGRSTCAGPVHFNFAYDGVNPANGFQATLLLINQQANFISRQLLTTPVNGVDEGNVNKDFTAPIADGYFDSWNIKICKQAQCAYAYPNGQRLTGQEPPAPNLNGLPGGVPAMPGQGGNQIPQGQTSVVLDSVNPVNNPGMAGFSDEVVFTINFASNVQYAVTLTYDAQPINGGVGAGNQRHVFDAGSFSRGQNRVIVPLGQNARTSDYLIEVCNNGICVHN